MQNPPSPLFSFQAEQEKNATIKNNQINKEMEEKPVEELKEVKRDPKSKKKKEKKMETPCGLTWHRLQG